MRVLLTTDIVGGVWTFTRDLASGLLQLTCDVLLVSFGRHPSSEQQAHADELTALYPGRFHYVSSAAPLEWMPGNSEAYTAAAPLLLQVCASFRPDALLLSQFCFGALPVDAPKVVIAHSDVLSWAAAVGKAPLADDDWLQTYRTLVPRGLADADAVVAPTQAMLNDLRTNFSFDAPAQVIANGRSLRPHSPTLLRKMQAITAGRMWDEAKHLSLLREVTSPMPILIAGDHRATLTPTAGVTSLGHLSEEELLHRFRESVLYLCPSTYEPFGLAPLEAALCGCAVLVNDIPSLREVWDDSALYFHDASSLSALLHRLYEDAEELANAQRRSHARALRYTTENMAAGYLQLIQSLRQARGSEAHAA